MTTSIRIDPVTRIEGHLSVTTEINANTVVKAFSSGEMFRGFEVILKGRDPLDAQQIVQRICGVCPVSHGMASILAQDQAYGVNLPSNGRLLRNLILGAEYIHSHLIHFYHLSALDFVDVKAILKYTGSDPTLLAVKAWVESELASNSATPAAPLLPRYEGTYIEDTELNIMGVKHYLEALEMRKQAHKMGAIFAGKLPHAACLIPGGVAQKVTAKEIVAYASILSQLRTFIDTVYIPDVLAVAKAFPDYFQVGKGCGNFLAYGVFPESSGNCLLPSGAIIDGRLAPMDPSRITEDVACSRFSSESGLHPSRGATTPDPEKSAAYSWIKAPRYSGEPMEVGPLARVMVAYQSGDPQIKKQVDGVLTAVNGTPANLVSVLGRHAARAVECKVVADRCAEWVSQLQADQPSYADFRIPDAGSGTGLTEAPRGALGHWLDVKGQKIERYQCIVPTTWNCSPRDDKGRPGPLEQALEGTPIADEKNPIEAARVVRSFDPCIACAVH
jgi:ferredoxin hydrogenase large subunit/hydrogenase large subunit